tara:strand:+ start:80 stop:244 length:165 start_codon:yes stop_codon:yes gene_type:complete
MAFPRSGHIQSASKEAVLREGVEDSLESVDLKYGSGNIKKAALQRNHLQGLEMY